MTFIWYYTILRREQNKEMKEVTNMKTTWIEYRDCGEEGLWFYGEHNSEEKARKMAERNDNLWCTFEEAIMLEVNNLPY